MGGYNPVLIVAVALGILWNIIAGTYVYITYPSEDQYGFIGWLPNGHTRQSLPFCNTLNPIFDGVHCIEYRTISGLSLNACLTLQNQCEANTNPNTGGCYCYKQ